jgi:hypothetical protein
MDNIYREGFCPLLPSTQAKIAGALYRLCNDLAAPLGRASLSYAQFCGLITEHYEKIPWALSEELAVGLFPPNVITDSAVPDFSSVNTEEKLEKLLLTAPEPSQEHLEMTLKAIVGALPHLRSLLIAHGRELPHDRGGAPKKLGSPQEQEKIREEIKRLREPGIKLQVIFKRIADRNGVSASKIKQIWYSQK